MDGRRPDRGRSRVGGRRIRAAVLHRRAHLDSCWKAVDDQPAGFVFENRYQRGVFRQIRRRAVNRRGQLSVEAMRDGFHLLARTAADDDRRRAKYFFAQFWMPDERLRAGFEQ